MTNVDPYVYEGTDILRNVLGLRDPEILSLVEMFVSADAMAELRRASPPKAFDYDHLMSIHRTIFADIYPFAGKARTIDVWKEEIVLNGRSADYAKPAEIAARASEAMEELTQYPWPKKSTAKDWVALAGMMARIWIAHPFREGNTRTVLMLLDQFTRSRGVEIDFTQLSKVPSEVRDAFVVASEGDAKPLAKLLIQARNMHVGRKHSILGTITSEAVEVLNLMGNPPVRLAQTNEDVSGTVLCRSYSTVLVSGGRGVIGVPAGAFKVLPENNARIRVTVPGVTTATVEKASRDVQGNPGAIRKAKAAIKIRQHLMSAAIPIEIANDDPGMLTFDDSGLPEDLRDLIASDRIFATLIAGSILRERDGESYTIWRESMPQENRSP